MFRHLPTDEDKKKRTKEILTIAKNTAIFYTNSKAIIRTTDIVFLWFP